MGLFIANFYDNTTEQTQKPLTPEETLVQFIHDIKSPMTAIQTSLFLLKRDLPEHLKEAVQLLENSSLQISKSLEKERYRLFDLKCTVTDCLTETLKESKYANPKLKIELELGHNQNQDLIAADFRILRRILSNLIVNASEAEATLIKISTTVANQKLQIQLSDNGKGIPADILPLLGKRSYSYGEKPKNSGSGLGLSHAKDQLREWGGGLHIQSTLGTGTQISLNFRTL